MSPETHEERLQPFNAVEAEGNNYAYERRERGKYDDGAQGVTPWESRRFVVQSLVTRMCTHAHRYLSVESREA